MATIKQNAEKLRDVIAQEKDRDGSTFIDDLRAAAAAAIRAGVGSEPWKRLMTIFADNPQQLAVLTAKDNDPMFTDPNSQVGYTRVVSAYLAGGIMCTSETSVHLPQSIDPRIDFQFPSDGPDATFQKFFPFPLPPAQPAAPANPQPGLAVPTNNPSNT